MEKERKEMLKMSLPNDYRGTLYTDGTMDIFYKDRPTYLAGSNKVGSPNQFYRVLEMMPQLMREIQEQNDRDEER